MILMAVFLFLRIIFSVIHVNSACRIGFPPSVRGLQGLHNAGPKVSAPAPVPCHTCNWE